MPYTFTSETQNAVPGKSVAGPKTHTPGSRVKNLGHRFYMPGLGRWESRDPARGADLAAAKSVAESLYGFVRNGTVGNVDYLGLWTFEGCGSDKVARLTIILDGLCAKTKTDDFKECMCSCKVESCYKRLCDSRNLTFKCGRNDEMPCSMWIPFGGQLCGMSPPPPWPGSGTIWICDRAFTRDCGPPACTVLHEMTHKCQHVVFPDSCPNQAETCFSTSCRGL
jgi:RHS repeat-associated protein